MLFLFAVAQGRLYGKNLAGVTVKSPSWQGMLKNGEASMGVGGSKGSHSSVRGLGLRVVGTAVEAGSLLP